MPEPDALTPDEAKKLYDLAKPLGKKFVNDLKYKASNMELHVNNYEAVIEKIQNMIKEKGAK